MLSHFLTYLRRGIRPSVAWRVAFERPFWHSARSALLCLLLVAAATWALIHMVNYHFNAVAAAKQEQAAYVKALEQVVARCLSDGTGRPIIIDGQTHLCGVYPLGI